ncbi:hypothetical protein FOL47_010114 [Perkinsus chesapeaki]|uniref:Major facilitator superfamily (MFS) profile domain-containing protein n=1 Tax=Perkinsus chesapeaki TaxID=330153 RepID=A0A7J6L3T8_PERCH|nr:hypothetical protein FOL47_010114 [Perkinsus chesapeaki]
MLAPSTPWYAAKLAPSMDQGTVASVLMASYAIGTFCSSLVTGALSDRVGRRPVLLGAMAIFSASQFCVANSNQLVWFAIFRALGGTAAGTRPVIAAYLIDSSRPEDMKMYGVFFGLCVVGGQAIGSSIGGAMSEVALSFPFYFMGVTGLIVLILLLLFLTESLIKDENGMPVRKVGCEGAGRSEMAKNKYLIPTVICMSLGAFSGQYIEISWATVFGLLAHDQYNLSPSESGGILGLQVIATLIVNFAYLPITHVIEPGILASLGLFITSLIIVVPFIHNITGVLFLGMSAQAAPMLYFAGMAFFAAVVSPPKHRGLVNSIVGASANLGGIIGPFTTGNLYVVGPTYPFYLCLCISCLGATACLGIEAGIRYQIRLNRRAEEQRALSEKLDLRDSTEA